MNFDELSALRAEVREHVVPHSDSVLFFLDDRDNTFFRTSVDVAKRPLSTSDGRNISRITTTFTCLESLLESTIEDTTGAEEILKEFSTEALKYPGDWMSEGSAQTYCRVRSLAPMLRFFPDRPKRQLATARKLLIDAWAPIKPVDGSDGVYEHDDKFAYPPNAYLSYWALNSLNTFAEVDPTVSDKLAEERSILELWFEKSLCRQIALHAVSSRRCDPQQLAWSLSGYLISQPDPLPERKGGYAVDLVGAGLQAFFAQQDDNGIWSTGEPLFHYLHAGNAYCYIFETIAELLSIALLPDDRGKSLRRSLRPYDSNLIDCYRYAVSTERPLNGSLIGWCSGHHPHRTDPESWATASVYRFMQALRQLLGIWTREEAERLLKAKQPKENLETIGAQGDTWNAGFGSAGLQLASSFIHPVFFQAAKSHDPEAQVLEKSNARSAILFGPPGTGKTTFVESVAGGLGWKFIELSPANFLDQGVDQVSARADMIFRQLMELDHCVVLFDEIDELIRSRTTTADSLERFFTTTMLPRLAGLWQQRKILFFANTNDISHVDAAVRRSHRFDMTIFVLPPSFEEKQGMLSKDGIELSLTKAEVEAGLHSCDKLEDGSQPEGCPSVLAWFALLRYDQIGRFASVLKSRGITELASTGESVTVLAELGEELLESDWLDSSGNRPEKDLETVLEEFNKLSKSQRRDHDRIRVLDAEALESPLPQGVTLENNTFLLVPSGPPDVAAWAVGLGLDVLPDGVVSLP